MRKAPAGRVLLTLLAVVAVVAASCSSDASQGHQIRTVLVDFRHDEFASSMIGFFPRQVTLHAGDTVRFKQAWTGEPHTVTYAAETNDALGRLMGLADAAPATALPADHPDQVQLEALPAMLGDGVDAFNVRQNAAQPCYLEFGLPPAASDEPCASTPKPKFTGRHSYYSSGFIRYEGQRGNTFEVPLSSDIAPGSYNFYCNLHGVGQATSVTVVPDSVAIPSQGQVNKDGTSQRNKRFSAPLMEAFTDAQRGSITINGREFMTPLAGIAAEGVRPWEGSAHRGHLTHSHGTGNEFVPRTIRARAGERVTWTFVGRHTVSFNVPRYLPIFSVASDGEVDFNDNVHNAVRWPGRPDGAVPGTADVDAGEWDGRRFHSSGLDWTSGDRFSVTLTRPGSYSYACLVHPAMVGKLVVT